MRVKGVILCGGEGKRLRPLTYYFQKTMIPIGTSQKPLLEYIIKTLRYYGVDDLVLLVGYKHEQILNYFEDGSRFNVKISYVEDPKDKKGTGNALLNAYEKGVFHDADILLIYYGDILANVDVKKLIEKHVSNNAVATLVVATKYQVPVGVVETDEDRVVKMIEKPWLDLKATIGILTLSISPLSILKELSKEYREMDIMGHFIPELLNRERKIVIYSHNAEWYDVGTTERYEKLDNHRINELFKDII